jgi:hypothetical protein
MPGMLYAILCYHNEDVVTSWSSAEDEAVLAKRGKVTAELAAQGKMGPAIRLMPTSAATTIRSGTAGDLVLDGPFAETKEQLLGFYIIEGDSLDEVIDAAKRIKEGENCTFEIRPIRIFKNGVIEAEIPAAS